MNTVNFRSLYGAILFGSVAAFGQLAQAQTVIESTGTITEFGPEAFVIQSEVATAPTRYMITRDITYVDEAGLPVAASVVRPGVPVTIQYVREGDGVVARRVVVRQPVPGAKVIERREVTTAPASETVIRDRVPVAVEERVVRPAPVVVEERRPAVVEERRVVRPAPTVVEERKTTTTTTTNKRD